MYTFTPTVLEIYNKKLNLQETSILFKNICKVLLLISGVDRQGNVNGNWILQSMGTRFESCPRCNFISFYKILFF